MKRFSSYGPPSPRYEFMVQRPALVQHISGQLIGNPEAKGHYFTVFAPRQRGKTTTLRSVVEHIKLQYPDQFHVGMAILHLVEDLRTALTWILKESLGIDAPHFQSWEEVRAFFSHSGPLKRPVILILDEFDALPQSTLEDTIAFFRSCYHRRDDNWLHGVALIGVHSSLGNLEGRTSPFNVQRSVNIPNLTREEVFDLYAQYTAESGQPIEHEGVERIYELFRGQPGLTCWFGELLTEKYNTVQPPPWACSEGPPLEGYPVITRSEVERVLTLAQYSEININIRNLISKGMQHKELLRELFVRHDMIFDLNMEPIQWLYLNGILVGEAEQELAGKRVCAFASPFVQRCLFSAFGYGLSEAYRALELTSMADAQALWDAAHAIDVPKLLSLYRAFLARQSAKGDAPWSEQPSRSDARAFEAIGHFNLYAWLYGVARRRFVVVPEFPTGNGTADLWLVNQRIGRQEVLEVKSFTEASDLTSALAQLKRYAQKLTLNRAFLVVMADASAYAFLSQQPSRYEEAGLEITLELIPWGFVPGAMLPVQAPAGVAPSASGPSSAPKKSRRSARPTAVTIARLSPEERLALEVLVMPHLTPASFKLIQLRLGREPVTVTRRQLPIHWGELVLHCETAGSLSGLAGVLRFTFPALADHPLLTTLERLRAPA